MTAEKIVLSDSFAAAEKCGEKILEVLENAHKSRGRATMAISGGSTPRLLFEWLSGVSFDWARVHLFWVDERAVPPGDPHSNFTLADTHWLALSNFPKENIHRIPAELPVSDAAQRYTDEITGYFGQTQPGARQGALPVFDIIQQGMGADGHTASLFPGEALILDRSGIAAAVYVEKLKAARITLLPGVLAAARNTFMLVCGEDKRDALEAVLDGPENLLEYPAQLTRHHAGNVVWFLDKAAAGAHSS